MVSSPCLVGLGANKERLPIKIPQQDPTLLQASPGIALSHRYAQQGTSRQCLRRDSSAQKPVEDRVAEGSVSAGKPDLLPGHIPPRTMSLLQLEPLPATEEAPLSSVSDEPLLV